MEIEGEIPDDSGVRTCPVDELSACAVGISEYSLGNDVSVEQLADDKAEDVSRPSSGENGVLEAVPCANMAKKQEVLLHPPSGFNSSNSNSRSATGHGKPTKSNNFNCSSQNGRNALPYADTRDKKSRSNYNQSKEYRHHQHKSFVSYSYNNKYQYVKNRKTNHSSGGRKSSRDEEVTRIVTLEPPSTNQNYMNEDETAEDLSTNQNFKRDSELSADLDSLNILNNMTAIEFDRDRYARYGIHESEIKDEIRTDTFKRCIELCASEYIKNKVVLVIRSGIGFLPLLCVRFGFARRVIGLEQSACIDYARLIVNDNCYSDQITLIQSSVQNLEKLPHGLTNVDVIISDCLGDCVLGQGDQMEQVIEARNRFLSSEGIMIPLIISLYCQLSEQRRAYENCRIRKKEKKVINEPITETNYESDGSTDSNYSSWWSNVYGFDMRSNPEYVVDQNSENGEMNQKWRIMPEPLNSYFNHCRVVSSSALLKKFNLKNCSIEDLRFFQCKDAVLNCITPYTSTFGGDYAHMLELFMTVDFPNGKGSTLGFSTSSSSPCTRYKQTGLLLRDQILILEGDKFKINEFSIRRGPQHKIIQDGTSTNISENNSKRSKYEESLKLRLNYTFVNKYVKAIDRRCAYTVTKYLY